MDTGDRGIASDATAPGTSVLKKISPSELAVGMFISGFEGSWLNHPFWKTQFLVEDDALLRRVRDSGVEACWIDTARGRDTAAAMPAPVSAPSASDAAQESAPGAAPTQRRTVARTEALERAVELRRRSTDTMRQLFTQLRLGEAIEPKVCAPIVEEVIESITQSPDALISVARLKSADEYTYMHSVSVCALMISLGRQLGLDAEECREAGLAGMLHDLGKAAVPIEILNKPGRLTSEEFEIVKQHSIHGYDMLVAAGGISTGVLEAVRHHHERMDGAGYPDRLKGTGISRLARMAAVCDVYDAVTSDRPYKAGWDPAYAIAQMASWQGQFDAAVFQCFVRSVGIYPTGALVRMESGLLGVVFEQNPKTLTKPKVKLFYSTGAQVPIEPRIVDLSAPLCRDRIQSRESPEQWNFRGLNELWAGACGTIVAA